MHGLQGEKGSRGETVEVTRLNWKQCVWYREDPKDSGLIQVLFYTITVSASVFSFLFFNRTVDLGNITTIQHFMSGTFRVFCTRGSCCFPLVFTFNGQECSGPMAIDGILYGESAITNPHRHRQIEGYCENISAGQLTIAFNIRM